MNGYLAKQKEQIKGIEVPEWMQSLLIWRSRWHHKKQLEYVKAQRDFWEVAFRAGNGSGKSHIFYWSIVNHALGIHPYQLAKPPLAIKVLVTDFEHGYGKIFTETVLRDQYMPKRYEIWPDEKDAFKYLAFFCEESRAEDWIRDNRLSDVIIKQVRSTKIGPLLHKSIIKKEPSRDDRTLMLDNGSFIFFQTSEQKKRLHSGTNFDILACDEVPAYQIYDESKRGLRTAKGDGRILHAFTPPFDDADRNKGPDWTKDHLIDAFEKGTDPDVYVVKASIRDNPAITNEYIRRFSRGKTEWQLRVQLEGDYPPWGRMILSDDFQDFLWDPKKKEGHLLPHDWHIDLRDPDYRHEMAIDWHSSKPAAVVWASEDLRNGNVYFWDELPPESTEGYTITELKYAIREREGFTNARIKRYGDPKMKDKNNAIITGYSAWDEFRARDINKIRLNLVEAWNRDPGVGYSIVLDYLRGRSRNFEHHPRVFFKETMKSTIYNIKNHYWKDGKPDEKFRDYVVSVKYILQEKKPHKFLNRNIGKHSVQRDSRWPLTSFGDQHKPSIYIQPRVLA